MTTLRVGGLNVRYGDFVALTDVSLAVPTGGFVAVIGPNGAGKSTLLRAVHGLVKSHGLIELDGQPSQHLSARERARLMAYLPQTPELPPGMSVFEFVLLGRTPHLGILRNESGRDVVAAREAMQLLDLMGLADRDVSHLSGGEAQRCVLARALAQEAEMLLLDEPTTGLDIGRQQEAMTLIDGLRKSRGITVLATVHDLTLAGQFAEHLVWLVGGRVVSAGLPHDILTVDNIRQHYGAEVRVIHDDAGGVVVVPTRPTNVSLERPRS